MLMYDGKKVERQVPPSTRISALKAMISRTFGISVRKKRIVFVEGGRENVVGEGDGGRDVGWFVSGRTGEVIIE